MDGPGITLEKHCFRQRGIFGSLQSTEVRSEGHLGRISLEPVTKLKTRGEGLKAGRSVGRQRAGDVLGRHTSELRMVTDILNKRRLNTHREQ